MYGNDNGCASILPFVGILPTIWDNPENAFPVVVVIWKFEIAGYRISVEPVLGKLLFFITLVFLNPVGCGCLLFSES